MAAVPHHGSQEDNHQQGKIAADSSRQNSAAFGFGGRSGGSVETQVRLDFGLSFSALLVGPALIRRFHCWGSAGVVAEAATNRNN